MGRKGELSTRIQTRRGPLRTPAKIGHLQEFDSLYSTLSSRSPFLAKNAGEIPLFGHSPSFYIGHQVTLHHNLQQ